MDAPRPTSDICPECGSGLLDGLHIADYPCVRKDLAHIANPDVRARVLARVTDLEARLHVCAFPSCVDGHKPAHCGHCGDAERAEAAEAQVAALTQERNEQTEVTEDVARACFNCKERAEAAEAQLATTRQALATLVRFGFLLTVNGERAKPDDVKDPAMREILFTILQAKDTDAACRALAATEEPA